MVRQMLLKICVALWCAVMPGTGSAWAEWPGLGSPQERVGGGEQDVALVVAIEDYAMLPRIPGAISNGTAWHAWFTRTRGMRPDRVRFLKNAEGTPSQILQSVGELAGRVGPGGTFWFVFIGHGAPSRDATDGMLVGFAAQQNVLELYAQSLAQSRLFESLAAGGQAANMLVIDSCFSGLAPGGGTLTPGAMPTLLNERPSGVPRNTAVVTAGRSSEFAGPLPYGDRPAFSYLVLGGLRGWADDPEYGNGDGVVTAGELVSYSEAALAATLTGRSQTPQGFGALERALVKLPRGRAERGPDLVAIQQTQTAAGQPGGASHPGTGPVKPLGGGAAQEGGSFDLSTLDLAGLAEAEQLKRAIDRAQALEGDRNASALSRAEAWDAVAGLQVRGKNPHAAEAKRHADSWRGVWSKLGEMRGNWVKLQEALKLSVLDLGKKHALVAQFLGTYAGLSAEREYREAEVAKTALDAGNAFPYGTDLASDQTSTGGESAIPDKLGAAAVRAGLRGRFDVCGKLLQSRGTRGPITVRASFVIASSGVVQSARITDAAGTPADVQACVVKQMKGAVFGRFRHSTMTVNIPIRLL